MDMSWLSNEARQIHDLFSSLFYSLVVVLLAFGVLISFFKMSMGQVPEFLQLVGRAVIAAFLLTALPEIMNTLADLTDQISKDVGQLNNIRLVLERLGEKIHSLTWSWVNIKDSVLLLVSFVTFFLVYGSVYIANAMYLFTWTVLFVFSPLLIAAFTLPATASATKGLFQALVEVCLWKICWSVLAALLWSFALSEINGPKFDVDFITAICLNLILAFSVLVTPLVVRSLISGGLSNTASLLGGMLLATASLTPNGLINMGKSSAKKVSRSLSPSSKKRKNDPESEEGDSE